MNNRELRREMEIGVTRFWNILKALVVLVAIMFCIGYLIGQHSS